MANTKRKLTPEQQHEKMLSVLTPVVSVLLALIVGAVIIACLGKNPIQGYALLFSGSLGTPQKFASSLVSACPLIFTALAAAFAYRCGVFNLGGEGQFIMGAVSAIVFLLVTGIEGVLGTVLAILVGTVVGALWAALPGIMKITRGLNEMITSIMLNYVATLFMGFIYTNAFRDGGNPQTPSVADSVMLAKIPGFRIHTGVILAIVLGLVVAYVISKTSFGFKIRAVGLNPLASLIVAIFFGALTTGASSMQVGIMVPTAIVEIIRALIIIFSVAGVALIKLPKIQALIQQMGSGKAKKEEVNA